MVRELEGAARRALGWIDAYGDGDGDGFVEYLRRGPHGIDNQSGRTRGNSMAFHDGSLAESPIAPVEVQGYVYDAKLRDRRARAPRVGRRRDWRRGSSARPPSCASASTRRSGSRSG